ncbi:MAG: hydroxymethylglutaryl-CoA lyase [Parasphingorhabdus sp.]|jgi:hydroxymethylglutaryl-CoA lyase
MLPNSVRIIEVGPRDGLQNELADFDTSTRIELINRLRNSGITHIEAGAFVSPKWVPKMADTNLVLQALDLDGPINYAVLVPNMRGLDLAIESNVKEIAVFSAATESFSNRNINCGIQASLDRFRPVCERALQHNIRVRGYISCVLGCPYEGEVKLQTVDYVANELFGMGCYEVSLGDTIGTGTPLAAARLIEQLARSHAIDKLAVHFHDTYGQALANIYAALQQGISAVDCSVAGLGGCPYAPGAAGNVATEDVVYMLNGMGVAHNVDLEKLIDTAAFILNKLNKNPVSRVSAAMLAKRNQ